MHRSHHSMSLVDDFADLKRMTGETEEQLLRREGLWLERRGMNRVPSSLYRLQHLRQLFLQRNLISSIPDNIEYLNKLEIVYLSDNRISTLPATIGNLKVLKKIWLSNNQLSTIPEEFAQLLELEYVRLSGNYISEVPSSFGALSAIRDLDLSANALSALPDSLSRLQSISQLNLSLNLFQDFPLVVLSFSLLEALYMTRNSISELPGNWRNCVRLHTLDLSCNELSRLPNPLSGFVVLERLYLSQNQFAEAPIGVFGIASLEVLDLSCNARLTSVPNQIGKMAALREFVIHSCKLTTLPQDLGRLRHLEILNISRNMMSTLPTFLCQLPGLQKMNVSENRLEAIPAEIGNLRSLHQISLNGNRLSSLPNTITYLALLEKCELDGNRFKDGEDKVWEAYFRNREVLNLSGQNLTNIPSFVEKLAHIVGLDISNNNISFLPSSIRNFKKLAILNISYNKLSRIPDDIGSLPSLTEINVSGNQLTEDELLVWQNCSFRDSSVSLVEKRLQEFPDCLSRICFLKKIDLSGNFLQEIPDSITRIEGLKDLNVSNNRLSHLPDNISKLDLDKIDISSNKMDDVEKVVWETYATRGLTLNLSRRKIETIPDCLSKLSNLQDLDLSNNLIIHVPGFLGSFSHLNHLNLRQNRISSLPDDISRLSGVSIIEFEGNLFSNGEESIWQCFFRKESSLFLQNKGIVTVSDTLRKLTHVTRLDLSGNGLSTLSDSIGMMTSLEILNLSNNMITYLPDTIGQLTNLQELSLKNNKLTLTGEPHRQAAYRATRSRFEHSGMHTTESSSDDSDTNDGEPIYTVSLPPSLCCIPKCKINLVGNIRLPANFLQQYPKILFGKLTPLERVLKCMGLFDNLPSTDELLYEKYEDFSKDLLNDLSEKKQDDAESDAHMREIIELAVRADALEVLSHPLVSDAVSRTWLNRADLRSHLMTQQQKISWWEDGLWKGIGYLIIALRSETPKFIGSPAAKFFLSATMYLTYVIILTMFAVQYNSTYNDSTYYFTMKLQNTFDTSSVTDDDSFWNYVLTEFGPAVYGGAKGDGFSPPSQGSIGESYFLLSGPIRFRQLRSKQIDCITYQPDRNLTYPRDQSDKPYKCVPPFISDYEDRSPYGVNDIYKWKPKSKLQSPDLAGLRGQIYPGDGYAVYISPDSTKGQQEMQDLKDTFWTDMQTRLIAIEFLVTNDNLNLLSSVYLIFEVLASGSTVSSTKIITIPRSFMEVKTDTGNDQWIRPVFVVQVMLAIYAFGFLFHELQQLINQKTDYLKDAWNAFDISLFTLLFAILGLQLVIYDLNPSSENYTEAGSPGFLKFQETSRTLYLQKELLAILLFMSWARVLFYLGIHPSFGPMQLIIKQMSFNMAQFLLLLFLFLFAFSTAFYTIYGSVMNEYSSILNSSFSLGNALFGNFEFDPLNDNDMFLGPILLFGFLLVCSVLLMNFLIAILSGTYEDIQTKSEEKYRQIFADTVISLLQSPWPAPLNLTRPLFIVITPLWGFLRPVLRFIDHLSWWAWEDRMRGWYFLWEDEDLDAKITSNMLYPLFDAFEDYADLFGDMWVTSWIDYGVIVFAWLFTVIFSIFLSVIRLISWLYNKIVPHRVRHEITKELEFLEELTGKKQKKQGTDSYTEMQMTFYRFSIRVLWIGTYFFWYPLYFLRYIWMLKEIEEARLRAKKLGGLDFESSKKPSDNGSDFDVCFSEPSMVVSNRSHGTVCVYGKKKWNKKDEDIWYFEVEILSPGWISIGVMLDNTYHSMMPGKAPNSIGFDSRTGDISSTVRYEGENGENVSDGVSSTPTTMTSNSKSKEDVVASYPVWCNTGDVAGCGIEFNGGLVFFTHQGRLLHHTIQVESEEVYPAVGLYGFGNAVRINFGSYQFKLTAPETLLPVLSNYFEKTELTKICLTSDSMTVSYFDAIPSVATIIANQPWTDDVLRSNYFETEIINIGKSGVLYIGATKKDFNRTLPPGSLPKSIGYRLEITRISEETPEVIAPKTGRIFTFVIETDKLYDPIMVGCGVSYKTRALFLTLNGQRLDIPDAKWLESGDIPALHAAVTLTSQGQCLRAIFDASVPPSEPRLAEESDTVQRVRFNESIVLDSGFASNLTKEIGSFFGRSLPSVPQQQSSQKPSDGGAGTGVSGQGLDEPGNRDSQVSDLSRAPLVLERQASSMTAVSHKVAQSCRYLVVVEESVFRPEQPKSFAKKEVTRRRSSANAMQNVGAQIGSVLNLTERSGSVSQGRTSSVGNGLDRKESRAAGAPIWSNLLRGSPSTRPATLRLGEEGDSFEMAPVTTPRMNRSHTRESIAEEMEDV